jgi:hypothetical protein
MKATEDDEDREGYASSSSSPQSGVLNPSKDGMEVDPASDGDNDKEGDIGTDFLRFMRRRLLKVLAGKTSKSHIFELALIRSKLAAEYDRRMSEHLKALKLRQTLEQAAVKMTLVLEMLEKGVVPDVGVAGGK